MAWAALVPLLAAASDPLPPPTGGSQSYVLTAPPTAASTAATSRHFTPTSTTTTTAAAVEATLGRADLGLVDKCVSRAHVHLALAHDDADSGAALAVGSRGMNICWYSRACTCGVNACGARSAATARCDAPTALPRATTRACPAPPAWQRIPVGTTVVLRAGDCLQLTRDRFPYAVVLPPPPPPPPPSSPSIDIDSGSDSDDVAVAALAATVPLPQTAVGSNSTTTQVRTVAAVRSDVAAVPPTPSQPYQQPQRAVLASPYFAAGARDVDGDDDLAVAHRARVLRSLRASLAGPGAGAGSGGGGGDNPPASPPARLRGGGDSAAVAPPSPSCASLTQVGGGGRVFDRLLHGVRDVVRGGRSSLGVAPPVTSLQLPLPPTQAPPQPPLLRIVSQTFDTPPDAPVAAPPATAAPPTVPVTAPAAAALPSHHRSDSSDDDVPLAAERHRPPAAAPAPRPLPASIIDLASPEPVVRAATVWDDAPADDDDVEFWAGVAAQVEGEVNAACVPPAAPAPAVAPPPPLAAGGHPRRSIGGGHDAPAVSATVDDEEVCTVCQEALGMGTEVVTAAWDAAEAGGATRAALEAPRDLGRLACGHTFCFECINTWATVTTHCCVCKAGFNHIERLVWRWAWHEPGASGMPPRPVAVVNDATVAAARALLGRWLRVGATARETVHQRISGYEEDDRALALQLAHEDGGSYGVPSDDDGDDDDDDGGGGARRRADDDDDEERWQCRRCGVSDNDHLLMLCDGCDAAWHTFCLRPPLDAVPEGHWCCAGCEEVRRTTPAYAAMSRGAFVAARQLDMAARRRALAAVAADSAAAAAEELPRRDRRGGGPPTTSAAASGWRTGGRHHGGGGVADAVLAREAARAERRAARQAARRAELAAAGFDSGGEGGESREGVRHPQHDHRGGGRSREDERRRRRHDGEPGGSRRRHGSGAAAAAAVDLDAYRRRVLQPMTLNPAAATAAELARPRRPSSSTSDHWVPGASRRAGSVRGGALYVFDDEDEDDDYAHGGAGRGGSSSAAGRDRGGGGSSGARAAGTRVATMETPYTVVVNDGAAASLATAPMSLLTDAEAGAHGGTSAMAARLAASGALSAADSAAIQRSLSAAAAPGGGFRSARGLAAMRAMAADAVNAPPLPPPVLPPPPPPSTRLAGSKRSSSTRDGGAVRRTVSDGGGGGTRGLPPPTFASSASSGSSRGGGGRGVPAPADDDDPVQFTAFTAAAAPPAAAMPPPGSRNLFSYVYNGGAPGTAANRRVARGGIASRLVMAGGAGSRRVAGTAAGAGGGAVRTAAPSSAVPPHLASLMDEDVGLVMGLWDDGSGGGAGMPPPPLM